MSSDISSLLISAIFVCIVVLISFLLKRYTSLSGETIRKFIHISVSNWAFILVYGFDDIRYAMAGPAAFIFINAFFVYSGMGRVLGMGERKRFNGLIYFPLSLLVLVALYYNGIVEGPDVIAGILIMGYGDGLAGLIGSAWGHHKYTVMKCTKSWEGTCVMFIVSLLIALLAGNGAYSLLIALLATALEALTPFGLDNITVPILSSLAGALL